METWWDSLASVAIHSPFNVTTLVGGAYCTGAVILQLRILERRLIFALSTPNALAVGIGTLLRVLSSFTGKKTYCCRKIPRRPSRGHDTPES